MIKIGQKNLSAAYVGSRVVNAIYKGATLLWQAIRGLTNYTIKGNSVVVDEEVKGVGDEFAFNQLINISVPSNIGRIEDGGIVVNEDFDTVEWGVYTDRPPIIIGHKYLSLLNIEGVPPSKVYAYTINSDILYANTPYFQVATSEPSNWTLRYREMCAGKKIVPQLFDLTALGVQDSVTNLAEFKAYLVSKGLMQSVDDEIPYFAYDSGSTKTSCPLVAHSLNLWDEEWELGGLDGNGNPTASNENIRSKNYVPVVGGRTYRAISPSGTNLWIYTYNSAHTKVGNAINSALGAFSVPSDAAYLRLRTSSNYGTTYNHDICISEGSTATAYTPYYRATYPLLISSPLHKVGDAADALVCTNGTGSIVRKFAKIVFDGTEDWWSNGFYNSPEISGMKVVDQNVASPIICNLYPVQPAKYGSAYPSVDDQTIRSKGAYPVVIVKDTTYASVDAWKAHLAELYAAGNPLVVVYELAASTTESVDLPQITEWEDGYILTTDTEVAPSEVVTD